LKGSMKTIQIWMVTSFLLFIQNQLYKIDPSKWTSLPLLC
jgi:hypothetical protein